jgi:glycosyltransferase involved in cell wall biosynthesis
MLKNRPYFSLVVPAFNEVNRIETTLSDLLANNLLTKDDCEVIVIMDGCTDGTEGLVNSLTYNIDNVTTISRPKRLGKGGAIIEALKNTRGDIIAFVDADGSVPAWELERLVSIASEYDLVIGSRYDRNSILPMNRPFSRELFSRAFNVILRVIFWRLHKVRDTQCGIKVFSRKVADAIKDDLIITDFAFDVNLIYSALKHGFVVKEVGITWMDKNGGKLSGGLTKIPLFMAFSLFKLRLYYSAKPVLNSKIFKTASSLLYYLLKR